MKPIKTCSVANCGLLIGYDHNGAEICWLHAEKAKLPAHAQWKRERDAFLRDSAETLVKASTNRDNYGVLGRP